LPPITTMAAAVLRLNSDEPSPLTPFCRHQPLPQSSVHLFHPSSTRRSSRSLRLQVQLPPKPPLFPSPRGRPAPPRCWLTLGTGAAGPPEPTGGITLAGVARPVAGRASLPLLCSVRGTGERKKTTGARRAPHHPDPTRQRQRQSQRPGPQILNGDVFWRIRFPIWKAHFLSATAKNTFSFTENVICPVRLRF
jgi:hypothetical protein